ncbi:MAG: hypothetical protein ACW99F_12320 [Candidatus Hodarchaeales archaeon]|jgi:hypothetical protein
MKKIISTVSAAIISFLAVFGINVSSIDAKTVTDTQIMKINNQTPLYLEQVDISTLTGENDLLTWHYSHYSHQSHYSHYSHNSHYSHQSHYSHYSGY